MCLPLCRCVCANRCPTVKYLYPQASQTPMLLTELTLLLSNQSQASVTAGGGSLTDSLNSCARLCARVLSLNRQRTPLKSLKSIITIAPVLRKCRHQLKRPPVCLFVCLSVCLSVFVCLFFTGAGGKKEENG